MAKGISIGVASDTREFAQGIARGVIAPLEEAGDALDGVARDGDKAGDKLEEAFERARKEVSDFKREQERAGKELQDSTGKAERFGKSARDAAKTGESAFGKLGKSIGNDVKDGARKGERAVDEMGDEIASEAKEMGASFGSVEDALDSVQSIVANVFAGLGPAGIVAGTIAAAGIGLLMANLTTAAEKVNITKESVGALANEIVDAGGDISRVDIGAKIREWGVEIADSKEFWEVWQKGAKSNIDKAAESAQLAGSDFDSMFRALSGYSADDVETQLLRVRDAIEANKEAQAENGQLNILGNWDADADLQKLYNLETQLETTSDVMGDSALAADALKSSTEAQTAAAELAAVAAEQQATAIAAVDSAYDEAAGAVDGYINAETGMFDTGAYLAAMDAKKQALIDYQTTLQTSGLTPEAKAFLDSQGTEAAATFLAGYVAAEPGVKDRLNAVWTEAGKENSGQYAASLQGGMPATVAGPTVTLGMPDIGALRAAISTGLNAGGAIGVRVQGVTPDGKVVR